MKNLLKPLNLSKNQEDILNTTLTNSFLAINGVPGAGKTTLLAWQTILLLQQISFNKNDEDEINILFTANTYAAIEEFIRKLENYTKILDRFLNLSNNKKLCIYKYLRDCNKQLKIILRKPKYLIKMSNNFSKFIEKICINNRDYLKLDENCKFNIYIMTISKFKNIPLAQNYYIEPFEFNENIDILLIDEASQVSALGVIEVFASIPNIPEKIIITGDTQQLPPIYSIGDATIPYYTIGALYNVFTFFESKYFLKNLYETRRVKKEIVEIIQPLYEKIESKKGNRKIIKVKENLKKILDDYNLQKYPILRFKINYKNKNCRRSCNYEAKLIEFLINNIETDDIAILSPFKEQEKLLEKNLNIQDKLNLIIGTIDKLQGKEKDVTILSFSTNHTVYTKKIIPFIATPNRLNVALTRAKENVILIHSDTFEEEIFTAYDKDSIDMAREILIGFKRFNINLENESEALKKLRAIDTNLGIEILRKLITKTNKEIKKLKGNDIKEIFGNSISNIDSIEIYT